jgi:hypothetical protein
LTPKNWWDTGGDLNIVWLFGVLYLPTQAKHFCEGVFREIRGLKNNLKKSENKFGYNNISCIFVSNN